MKRLLVIDGQGGRIGRSLIEQLAARFSEEELEITAVGTNASATAGMMKAGGSRIRGATGENAVVVCSRRADIIAGPLGIVMADALLGEITERAACAVSSASAVRVLIPMNRTQCDNIIAGVPDVPLGTLIGAAAEEIGKLVKGGGGGTADP